MKRRDPTDEERDLWQEHTKSDKRLPKDNPLPPAKKTAPILSVKPKAFLSSKPSDVTKTAEDLQQGDTSHMDGRNAVRFHKGKLTTDAILDLHGFKRDEAFSVFRDFILSNYTRGKRNLLIITGKGRIDSPGILRELLSRWINDETVRPLILAYDTAQPRHGGSGAFYIRLKKRT